MDQNVSVTITPRTILTTVLILCGVALLFFLLDLVLVVLTAIVIASGVEPLVAYLKQYKIPRVLSVLLIYSGIVGLLFCLFYFFFPPVIQDAASLVTTLPQYLDSFEISGFSPNISVQETTEEHSLFQTLNELRTTFTNTSAGLLNTITVVFGGLLSFFLIIVLSFYFAVQEQGIDDFLRIVLPVRHQEYAINLWRRSQEKIGKWLQGQIMLSLILGILVYLGLSILGVRYALLLAILAALFELIPVFGSILAAIPAVAVAFIDGETGLALLVIGYYIIINQFQANLIYPLVVQKVVGVPPLLVILALIIGWNVAGFLGIILSVPAAAALREFLMDVQLKKEKQMKQEQLLQADS